jgi:hypothetical protein
MKLTIVEPSPQPNRIFLGPKYSHQDPIFNTLSLKSSLKTGKIYMIALLSADVDLMYNFNNTCLEVNILYVCILLTKSIANSLCPCLKLNSTAH